MAFFISRKLILLVLALLMVGGLAYRLQAGLPSKASLSGSRASPSEPQTSVTGSGNENAGAAAGGVEQKAASAGTGTGSGTERSTASQLVSANKSNYFIDYRLERERSRGQEIELLKEIINNPASDEQVKQEANQRLFALVKSSSQESQAESLLKAKGFPEAVVCLGQENATVVVQASQLLPDEVLRITDLVSRSSGVPAERVVIIPRP
ncbi:SpoIIIAH-like family protein [Desulfurispora thermophila]|uniref:SpoIIIAH-like family protein n=1 Tax=Desulfurispora thermophila TaxID=265470 RepID=UPI00035C2C49|nr:SpoIIIAH-like family protein [Desulfurispora thermophila]